MMHAREKVGPCHSSYEADEQSGGIRIGAGGAKGGTKGNAKPAKHRPDAKPGNAPAGARRA